MRVRVPWVIMLLRSSVGGVIVGMSVGVGVGRGIPRVVAVRVGVRAARARAIIIIIVVVGVASLPRVIVRGAVMSVLVAVRITRLVLVPVRILCLMAIAVRVSVGAGRLGMVVRESVALGAVLVAARLV